MDLSLKDLVSISTTLYVRIFRTNVNFSSYVLALSKKFVQKIHEFNVDEIDGCCNCRENIVILKTKKRYLELGLAWNFLYIFLLNVNSNTYIECQIFSEEHYLDVFYSAFKTTTRTVMSRQTY
jgi:hypothetical protein